MKKLDKREGGKGDVVVLGKVEGKGSMEDNMTIPKIFNKPVVISVSIFWLLSIILVIILGFENARKILGFIGSFIGLPTAIISFIKLIYILDEGKLINRALIEAGKKDQDELEKMKKQTEQCVL